MRENAGKMWTRITPNADIFPHFDWIRSDTECGKNADQSNSKYALLALDLKLCLQNWPSWFYRLNLVTMEIFSLIDCTLIRFDEKDSHGQLNYMYNQGPTPLYILNYDERNATLHNATCMILISNLTGPKVLSVTKVFNYHSCHVRCSDKNLFVFFQIRVKCPRNRRLVLDYTFRRPDPFFFSLV